MSRGTDRRRVLAGLIGAGLTGLLGRHEAAAAPCRAPNQRCRGTCCPPPPNGSAACCSTAGDCPGTDTECQTRTCTNGCCGVAYAASGTPLATQVPRDCQQQVCDGAGGVTSVADNADVPADDGNQCTDEVCVQGVPAHPNSRPGTPCSQNGGTACDGAGNCVV